MSETIDVFIVGAGPAGGSTALQCAKKGLETILIEEHEKIGEPVHCGECLSQHAAENTGLNLPEKVISQHVKGVKIIFPNGKETALNEPGYVLEKNLFEQWLSKEAVKAGANLMLGTRLEEIERKNNLWEIKTSKGNFKAKTLIDASGVTSFVSRKLGLNTRFETVTGIQYELEDIPMNGYLDFYLWPLLAPHGYLWMIPKSNGRANVGLVTTERNNAKKFLDLFLKKMKWETKEKVKTFGGLIPSSGPLEKTFGERLMIIGDAAGFTSPLFEGGTQLGLKSGQIASKIAKKAIEENNFSKEMFSQYQTEWQKEFPKYETLVKGKSSLYGFSDDELNFIGNRFPENFDDFKLLEKIKFGLNITVKKPGLLSRGFMPAMNALKHSQAKFYGW